MGRVVRQCRFAALVAVGLCGVSGTVAAWGHLPELNMPVGRAHIVFAALERGRIGYCVEVLDPNFAPADMDLQVAGALNVWLAEWRDLVDDPVAVARDCDAATLDLMVVVGPAEDGSTRYGRHDLVALGERTISHVSVNTAPMHGIPVTRTNIFDLFGHVSDAAAKEGFLHRVRTENLSLTELAVELGLETTLPLTRSLYQTMIHEIGHSFGLCDVKEGVFERRCDPRFRTRPIATAVMATSGALNLNFDDREGIVRLFERFSESPRGE